MHLISKFYLTISPMGIITFVGCIYSGFCGLGSMLAYCISPEPSATSSDAEPKKEYEKSTQMKEMKV